MAVALAFVPMAIVSLAVTPDPASWPKAMLPELTTVFPALEPMAVLLPPVTLTEAAKPTPAL